MFGQVLQPSQGNLFGSLFQNLGSKLGQIYQRAQASPVLAPLLEQYKIPQLVSSGKQVAESAKQLAPALQGLFGAGKQTFEELKKKFQR